MSYHTQHELDLSLGSMGQALLPPSSLPTVVPLLSYETSSMLSMTSAPAYRRQSTDDSSMMSSIVSRGSKLDLLVSIYANDFRLPLVRSATPAGSSGGIAANSGPAPLGQSPSGSFRLFSVGAAISTQLSRASVGSSNSIRRISSGQQSSGPLLVPSGSSLLRHQRHVRTARGSCTSSEEATIVRRLQQRPLLMTTVFLPSLFKHINKRRRPLGELGDVNHSSGIDSISCGGAQLEHAPFEDIGELVTSFDGAESGVQSLESSIRASEMGWESSSRKQTKQALPTPRIAPPPLDIAAEYTRSGRLLTQPAEPVKHIHVADGYERCVDNSEGDLIVAVGVIIFGWLEVVDKLGQGTFGQVFLCKDLRTCDGSYRSPTEFCPGEDFRYDYCSNDYCPNGDMQLPPISHPLVAVKVVKSLKHFEQQFAIEVDMLALLNAQREGDDRCMDPRIANQVQLAELGIGADARGERVCKMYAYGVAYGHRCVVLERLGHNLYDMISLNQNKGLAIHKIRRLGRQICQGISLLHSRCQIVHCDIKPENILVEMPTASSPHNAPSRSGSNLGGVVSRASSSASTSSMQHAILQQQQHLSIKLIDFSSSCYHGQECFTYIQSRYYRAPEVIVGGSYSYPIDMWSFGCLLAELFLGLPLLPGANDHQQLMRIEEMFGQVPDSMLLGASLRGRYFHDLHDQDDFAFVGGGSSSLTASSQAMSPLLRSASTAAFTECSSNNNSIAMLTPPAGAALSSAPGSNKRFHLMTDEQYALKHHMAQTPFVRYFQYTTVDRLLQCCPLAPEEQAAIQANPSGRGAIVEDVIAWRKRLLELLHGLLQVDPVKRWTVEQALCHPFLTE